MRSLLPICAGLLVVSGIVSVTLWRELRQARQASAEAPAPLAQPKPAPTAPVQVVPDPQLQAANAPAAPISPKVAPVAKAVAASGLMSTDVGTVAATRLEMLKDPEFRKARLAQIRASVVEGNPGVAEELGLSASETEQLFDMLAEVQLNTNMENNALRASGADEQTIQRETARIQQEARGKRQEALAALLGTAKVAQWQEYKEKTLPARNQATAQLTSVLAAAGQPVDNSADMQTVVAAMAVEQKRQREEMQSVFREVGTMDATGQAKFQAEILSKQEQSNRRILDAAAGHLSSGQLAALRSSFEKQITQAKEAIRTQQQQQQQRAAQ